jgi:hypothetical protein
MQYHSAKTTNIPDDIDTSNTTAAIQPAGASVRQQLRSPAYASDVKIETSARGTSSDVAVYIVARQAHVLPDFD